MPEIDKFEKHLRKKYKVAREKIQDAERLLVGSLNEHVEIDFFHTGAIRVSGPKCGLKFEVEELRDNYGKDVHFFEKLDTEGSKVPTPEEALIGYTSKELYDFLPPHDREAVLASLKIFISDMELPDFSPVAMPISRAYEGFFAKILVRLGVCTQLEIEDVKFSSNNALQTPSYKSFIGRVSTHEAKLRGAAQRLQEFRHLVLHSQSSQFVRFEDRAKVKNFFESVFRDMQSYFDYFKKYFVS